MNETRGLGRRDLLFAGGAGLMAAGLPCPLLAQAPKRGGKLRIGIGGGQTSNTLDHTSPIFASPNERTVNYTLFNTLVEIDPSGKAIPELAESWEVGPGARRWIFNLRRGEIGRAHV